MTCADKSVSQVSMTASVSATEPSVSSDASTTGRCPQQEAVDAWHDQAWRRRVRSVPEAQPWVTWRAASGPPCHVGDPKADACSSHRGTSIAESTHTVRYPDIMGSAGNGRRVVSRFKVDAVAVLACPEWNWSLALDLRILWKTISEVTRGC
jgi:hypothetical protein